MVGLKQGKAQLILLIKKKSKSHLQNHTQLLDRVRETVLLLCLILLIKKSCNMSQR